MSEDPSRRQTIWADLAARTVGRRPMVLVGIGVDQMRDFVRLGAQVRGAISLLPAGLPPYEPDEPFPVLTITGATRNIFDFVARDLVDACDRGAAKIGEFLHRVDPGRGATVVSYLPVPSSLLEGREAWAQDSAVCQPLEEKGRISPVEEALPFVAAEVVDLPLTRPRWDELCRRFSAPRLVLQKVGLSAGGRGTHVADSFAHAAGAFAGEDVGQAKVTPYIEGDPCNVMGSVLGGDRVVVFPPSAQLVQFHPSGAPVYGGNEFGARFRSEELDEITSEIRNLGTLLGRRGFVGPFGVDFIRDDRGRRHYHDLNPRMNGAVDNLSLYLADGGAEPLRVLLLCRREWSSGEVQDLENQLRSLVREYPMSRYFLTRGVTEPYRVEKVPPAGVWHVSLDGGGAFEPTLTLESERKGFTALSDEECILRPTLGPGAMLERGERLFLGDLYCTPALSRRLRERFGAKTHQVLVDALLR
jgi:hypothetical protein